MKNLLAVLALAAVALTGCHSSTTTSACDNNKCNVTITTDTQQQVSLFGGNLDVIAANISGNSASITIDGDTEALGPGETATVGGYKVTIAQLDGSSHTVKFSVYN